MKRIHLLLPLALSASVTTAIAGCAAGAAISPINEASAANRTDDGASHHPISVTIDGITEPTGSVRLALYSTAKNFAAREPIASIAEPVTGTSMTVSLGAFADGDYAVMMHQDLNSNKTLDCNVLGIPREPWGGSLSEAIMGAPDWEDVQFSVDGMGVALNISL